MEIKIKWSNWIDDKDGRADWYGVLYVYGTDDEILYLGQAGKSSVTERVLGHFRDGVVEFCNEVAGDRWRVKVGYVDFGGDIDHDLLDDIESLLIFTVKPRGNIANTVTRPRGRPGLTVIHRGKRRPLPERHNDPGPL